MTLKDDLFAIASSTPRDHSDSAEKYGLLALGGIAAFQAGLYFLGLAKEDRDVKKKLTLRCDALEERLHESEKRCQRLEHQVERCEEHRRDQQLDIRKILEALNTEPPHEN